MCFQRFLPNTDSSSLDRSLRGGAGGLEGRGAPAQSPIGIFLVYRSPANACNPLAIKDLSIKETSL